MEIVQRQGLIHSSIGFKHLKVYEISFMLFSALSFAFCVIVGAVASGVSKPQDPRTLNPELITPAVRKIFHWVAKVEIGCNFVS